ncbi:hypothetical protein [Bacillus toyonensis]|uniref:hypothetical protein n=1 Tax=Bacillus toyonensis TaxID=155322 RepID=UPI000BF8B4B8|nr:hypothetical protein [Bacillus toyonensis]PGF05062.1 hypothetical protein COM61_01110 [Bacillus toyonensis]
MKSYEKVSLETWVNQLNSLVEYEIKETQVHVEGNNFEPFSRGNIGRSTVHDLEELEGVLAGVVVEGDMVTIKLMDGKQSSYDLNHVTSIMRRTDSPCFYLYFGRVETHVEITIKVNRLGVPIKSTSSTTRNISKDSYIPVKDFINNKELVKAVNSGNSSEGYIVLKDVELRLPISALNGIRETEEGCLLSFHVAQTLDIKVDK